MEEKKRTLLAVAISCIILLAVAYSFGLNFLRSTPEVIVANTDTENDQTEDPGTSEHHTGIPIEVTPETVQSVIAAMSRYRSFSRTVEIRYSWDGYVYGEVTARIRSDGGWSRCDTTLASGLVEHSILGDGGLWYWYDDATEYLKVPTGERSEDLVQYIPTYEDVLEADISEIQAANYQEKDGVPCIYAELYRPEMDYTERYWISVTSGLLVAAETEKDGQIVYTMSSGDMVSPLAGGQDAFVLPDGEVLYQPQG